MTSSEPTRTPEDLAVLQSIMKDTFLIDCYIAFTQENGDFLGSGTLVSINNTSAILTADHVLEALPQEEDVGLISPTRFDNSPQSRPRTPTKIPMDYLEKKELAEERREIRDRISASWFYLLPSSLDSFHPPNFSTISRSTARESWETLGRLILAYGRLWAPRLKGQRPPSLKPDLLGLRNSLE